MYFSASCALAFSGFAHKIVDSTISNCRGGHRPPLQRHTSIFCAKPRLALTKSKRNAGGRLWPSHSATEEIREGPPTNIRPEAHGSPDICGFDSATIIDSEEGTIVGHYHFPIGIEDNGACRCIGRVELTAHERRSTVAHLCRQSTDSGSDVWANATSEDRTSTEIE